jgi:hypothetical protein
MYEHVHSLKKIKKYLIYSPGLSQKKSTVARTCTFYYMYLLS